MNPPKLSLPLSILLGCLLISAAVWQMSEKNRYVLTAVAIAGSSASVPYLCDTKTGRVWLLYGNNIAETKPFFDPSGK